MASLILRDPDPVQTGRTAGKAARNWSDLEEAKTKPGCWWEVAPVYKTPVSASGAAFDIKRGNVRSLPSGQWEACARTRILESGSTVGVLFVRYLGE